jgi:cytochrome c oxidase subunit 3
MGTGTRVERDLRLVHPAPSARRQIAPSEVIGTMFFILTEIMLFGGFISAFTISRTQAPAWPPPGQPRLPVELTAVNGLVLLASGALVWWAGRRFDQQGPGSARVPLLVGTALGATFVGVQGFEWVRLVAEGLSFTGSTYGAFFFLIVGAHGLHVLGGLAVLVAQTRWLLVEQLRPEAFWAGRLFWYFVVLLWPALYWKVYL